MAVWSVWFGPPDGRRRRERKRQQQLQTSGADRMRMTYLTWPKPNQSKQAFHPTAQPYRQGVRDEFSYKHTGHNSHVLGPCRSYEFLDRPRFKQEVNSWVKKKM